MHVGTTTVENLLRVARSDAAVAVAFAVLEAAGHAPRIISVPEAGSAEGISPDELAALVGQVSDDPEFLHARVFVRRVHLGRPLTLAVAPLREGDGHDMIGLVAEVDGGFEPRQLEVLEQVAERLHRHRHVVQRLDKYGAWDAPAPVDVEGALGAEGPPDAGTPDAGTPDAGTPDAGTEDAGTEANDTADSASVRGNGAAARAAWWAEPDGLTGLPPVGQFFSRAGRLLASDGSLNGSFVLFVLEVPERTTPLAARALSAQLRFTDPVARVDRDLIAVALVLFPAGSGDAVEHRLAAAVHAAIDSSTEVRSTHVVVGPGDRRDVDELLRDAMCRLPRREGPPRRESAEVP